MSQEKKQKMTMFDFIIWVEKYRSEDGEYFKDMEPRDIAYLAWYAAQELFMKKLTAPQREILKVLLTKVQGEGNDEETSQEKKNAIN